MPKDKYVGKVLYVKLPNNVRPRFRWIVRKRDDGRYIARTPKIGVLIRDLNKKRDADYNSEHLLPIGSEFRQELRKKNRTRKTSKRKMNKTRKN